MSSSYSPAGSPVVNFKTFHHTLRVRVLCVVDKMTFTNQKVLLSCHLGFHPCDKVDVFHTLKKESIVLFSFILF